MNERAHSVVWGTSGQVEAMRNAGPIAMAVRCLAVWAARRCAAGHKRGWLRAFALLLAVSFPTMAGAEPGTPNGAPTVMGVYIAEPVSAAKREWLAAARAGTIRAAIDQSFDGLCRPLVEVDGQLGRLSAGALLRLADNDAAARLDLPKSERTRTLVIAALLQEGKGYRIEITAIDVATGKRRARESGQAKTAAGLGAAVTAAAAKIKAALPCPVWRGDIVLTTTETRAQKGKDFSRTGKAEWTLLVRVDGEKTILDGRYSIRLVTQRCDKRGQACSVHVLEGAGQAKAAKGSVSGFKRGEGDKYTVTVGDAVAKLAMKTRLCRADGKDCQERRFETEQALRGAETTGTIWQSEDSVFGSATLVDTKTRKRVLSWQLERVLD